MSSWPDVHDVVFSAHVDGAGVSLGGDDDVNVDEALAAVDVGGLS